MSKGWCKRNESGAHGKHTDGAAPRWALSCRAAPRGPRGAPQPQTPVLPGLPDHLLSQRLQMASRQLPSPSLCGLPAEILLSIVDQLQEKADRQARVPCALPNSLCRCLVLSTHPKTANGIAPGSCKMKRQLTVFVCCHAESAWQPRAALCARHRCISSATASSSRLKRMNPQQKSI